MLVVKEYISVSAVDCNLNTIFLRGVPAIFQEISSISRPKQGLLLLFLKMCMIYTLNVYDLYFFEVKKYGTCIE